MASHLTPLLSQEDIATLLAGPTEDVRADIAFKVGEQVDAGVLSGQERLIANDILRLMVSDAADRVRAAMAKSIATCADIPHDVAQRLALDIDDIAVPFLEVTPALSDADLVAIVRGGSDKKSSAIAGREHVSSDVCDAIASDGARGAISNLLANKGADITTSSYGTLMDRWEKDSGVTGLIAARDHLPIGVTERLVTMISDEARDRLIKNHSLGDEVARRMALEAREAVTIGLLDGLPGLDNYKRLMDHLYVSGRLTGTLIVRAACMGEIQFVEHALAQLVKITPERAWTLVHDSGRLGLRALFNHAKLERELYLPLRIAVDVFHETALNGEVHDREHFRLTIIERVLTQPDGLKSEDLDFLLYQISRQEEKIHQHDRELALQAPAA